jgi:DNA-binding XRE family transcriptional regulator
MVRTVPPLFLMLPLVILLTIIYTLYRICGNDTRWRINGASCRLGSFSQAGSMQRIESAAALGAYMRILRRSKGLSQAEVGRRAGIRQATVSGIENAAGNASVTTLMRVLSALGQAIHLDDGKLVGSGPGGGWKEEC